jgi:hypothetical protein
MEISTPKTTRRSTRLRVQIPLVITSMDRRHPLSAQCVALVVSPQGCGIRAPQALPIETPVLLADLPGGGSATGRVANCLPLGNDANSFLIGVSLYNEGNVWGIADPPGDWNCSSNGTPAEGASAKTTKAKSAWPYNLTSIDASVHSGRK